MEELTDYKSKLFFFNELPKMLVARKQMLHKHFCGSQNATVKTGCVDLFWELVLLGSHYWKYGWEKLNLEEAGANTPGNTGRGKGKDRHQLRPCKTQAYLRLCCNLDSKHYSEQFQVFIRTVEIKVTKQQGQHD